MSLGQPEVLGRTDGRRDRRAERDGPCLFKPLRQAIESIDDILNGLLGLGVPGGVIAGI